MKKTRITILTMLLSLTLCVSSFSVTAFAGGGENLPQVPNISETAQPPNDPSSITPDGNLTVVDDIDNEQAKDKQFITMQSKNGNYFYLVIDRTDDKENVYFLNLVDEADLLALMEDAPVTPEVAPQCICNDKCQTGGINTTCTVCSINKSDCDGDPINTTEPVSAEDGKSNLAGLIIVLLIALSIGGGIFYLINIKKSKQSTKGTTNLDEYDFEDDDEYDFAEHSENIPETEDKH